MNSGLGVKAIQPGLGLLDGRECLGNQSGTGCNYRTESGHQRRSSNGSHDETKKLAHVQRLGLRIKSMSWGSVPPLSIQSLTSPFSCKPGSSTMATEAATGINMATMAASFLPAH